MWRFVALMLLGLVGCGGRPEPGGPPPVAPPRGPTAGPAGMSRYPYLAADGGPHILIPAEAAGAWSGGSSIADVIDPKSDYGRACQATATARMALIPVGSTSAVVFGDPPMTAWGKSSDGLVEVYYLESWTQTDLDALIDQATASLSTASLKDSGQEIRFEEPDAYLMFAGDTPSSSAYGVHRISIPAGRYKLLTGTYSIPGQSVTIYRLQPTGP